MALVNHVVDARTEEIVGGGASKQRGRTPSNWCLTGIKPEEIIPMEFDDIQLNQLLTNKSELNICNEQDFGRQLFRSDPVAKAQDADPIRDALGA